MEQVIMLTLLGHGHQLRCITIQHATVRLAGDRLLSTSSLQARNSIANACAAVQMVESGLHY